MKIHDEIRRRVLGESAAVGVTEPTPDDRPRFKDGRLVDDDARDEEEIDLDLLHHPTMGARYYRENKEQIDRYLARRADREAVERSESYLSPDGMLQSEYAANRDAILLRERRAVVERQIAELQKKLDSMAAPRDEETETDDDEPAEPRETEEPKAEAE